MRLESLLLALAFSLCGLPAQAQTVYKLIDKNGKVSYSDTAPKNFEGKVVPIEIDPKANVAQPPKIPPGGSPPMSPYATQRELTRNEAMLRLNQARDRYNAAKEAFDTGKDPQESEYQTLVQQGGTGRRVPNEQYYERQKSLEENYKNAERELAEAEQNYRRAN
jgi:hypothetical protein